VFSIFVGGFSFYVCRGAYAALEGLRQQTLEDADVARKFNEADTNGDGKLDINEIKCLCSSLGYNLSRFELESAFFVLDRDGGGDVSLEEFQYWFSHRSEV
jgi:Ca2+-binding EF-hand superfamily protein